MTSATDKTEQFRASRSTRSGPMRGQTDNDTLDGLPIRQWRKQESIIGASGAPNDITEAPSRGVGIWKELPMPEGSNNYPLWSQQILRAARAGRILKSQEIVRNLYRKTGGDDEKDVEAEEGADGVVEDAKRGVKRNAQGFEVKKWSQLSRQQEESFPEYLAPRRSGLPSIHLIPAVNPNNMRQTRVRRLDATNRPIIYEVLIAEGKTIDGEVTETLEGDDELVVDLAPGTLITGLGVANEHGIIVLAEAPAPLFGRGRPPPPRRKGKRGPGRGKKKVDFGQVTHTVDITDGVSTFTSKIASATGDVIMDNAANEDGGATPTAGDDEGEDGEDDEDDDGQGEGEDDEADADAEGEHDDEREEGELTPSTEPESRDASQVLQQFKTPDNREENVPPPPSSTLPQKPPPVTFQTQPQPLAQEPEAFEEDQHEGHKMTGNSNVYEPQYTSTTGLPVALGPLQTPQSLPELQQPVPLAGPQPQQPLTPMDVQAQHPLESTSQESMNIPGLSLAPPSMPEAASQIVVPPTATTETRSGAASVPSEPDPIGDPETGLHETDSEREEGEIE